MPKLTVHTSPAVSALLARTGLSPTPRLRQLEARLAALVLEACPLWDDAALAHLAQHLPAGPDAPATDEGLLLALAAACPTAADELAALTPGQRAALLEHLAVLRHQADPADPADA